MKWEWSKLHCIENIKNIENIGIFDIFENITIFSKISRYFPTLQPQPSDALSY